MHVHAGTAVSVPSNQPLTTGARRAGEQALSEAGLPLEALVETLNRLVKADLSAAGYRVALDTITRLASQGRVTECVGTQWVADRLDLHRNAVGIAYRDLEQAGIVRRTPVPKRGAPTRTSLIGPAETLVRRCVTGPQLVSNHDVYRAGTAGKSTPATSSTPENKPRPIEAAKTPDPAKAPSSPPVRVDPVAQMAQAKRISAAAREAAMTFVGKPEDFPINPDWNLKPEDQTFLRRLIPERTLAPVENTSPRVVPMAERAPPAIANALWHALPRLTKLTGCAKRAGQMLDEIAFMVLRKGLGKGDELGGVRAAISLVAEGSWKTPFGFSRAWVGAVLRGIELPQKEGDARKSVH